MPFRAGFIPGVSIRKVVLISAGSNQLHLCTQTVIQLAAVVDNASNLFGHSIEWIQITGSHVVLNNGNTLNPWYTEVDRTEKIFRIYIDKDTIDEQFKDVLISYKPESELGFSAPRNSLLDVRPAQFIGVDCDEIGAAMLSFDVPVPEIPFYDQHLEYPLSFRVYITWEHPGPPDQDLYITHYEVILDSLVVATVQCNGHTPIITESEESEGFGSPTSNIYDCLVCLSPLGFGSNLIYSSSGTGFTGFGSPTITISTETYPESEHCAEGEGPPCEPTSMVDGDPGIYYIRTHIRKNGIIDYVDSCPIDALNLPIPDQLKVMNDRMSSWSSGVGGKLNIKRIVEVKEEYDDEMIFGSAPVSTSSAIIRRGSTQPPYFVYDNGPSYSLVVSESPINITRIPN